MTVSTRRRTARVRQKISPSGRWLPPIYEEGILSGLIGAAVIAMWFFMIDMLQGRPFHTPNMLGRALFAGETAPSALAPISIDYRTVLMFTLAHAIVFVLIGTAAAGLIRVAGRSPNYGFGILLLLVIVAFEFIALNIGIASEVVYALTIPFVLIGNLVAAASMGYYFWRRHRGLRVYP